MYLLINNPENLNLDEFCADVCAKLYISCEDEAWYIPAMRQYWDKYLAQIYRQVDHCPTVKEVFEAYFKNLKFTQEGLAYIITVNPTVKLKNIDATVETLANLINYGTLDMPAYPLFDDVFDQVAEEITTLQEQEEEE